MFSYLDHLECTQCGKDFPHNELQKISSCCEKVLYARYDLDRLSKEIDRNIFEKRRGDMWRFSELLPVLGMLVLQYIPVSWAMMSNRMTSVFRISL